MAAEVAKMELDEGNSKTEETPRQVLTGYRPDLSYTEVTSATPGVVSVMTEVDNHEFHGTGADFVTAAERAALEVITYLYSTEEIAFGVERFNSLMAWKDKTTDSTPTAPASQSATNSTALSPLMIFNQLYQKNNPEWTVTQLSSHPPRYHAVLKVSDRSFEANESSKKLVRQKAAEAALLALRGSLEPPVVASPSRKRRSEDGRRLSREMNAPTPPKRKRRQESKDGPYVFTDSKHPLQILNEFRRGTVFETVSQEGPSHSPKIVMKCVVDDKPFQAEGTSKQKAKHQLAIDVITHFQELGMIQLVPAPEGAPVSTAPTPTASPASNKASPQVVGSGSGGKTPLMMLYELTKSKPACDVTEYEENKMKRFVAKYTFNGKTFEAEGMSKQRARHKAAELILRDVYGLQMGGTSTNGAVN